MSDLAKAHAARRRRRLLQNRNSRLKSILGENVNEETSNIEEIEQILDPHQPDEDLKVYYSPTIAQEEKKQEISTGKKCPSFRPLLILIFSSLFTKFFSHFLQTLVHFESMFIVTEIIILFDCVMIQKLKISGQSNIFFTFLFNYFQVSSFVKSIIIFLSIFVNTLQLAFSHFCIYFVVFNLCNICF